MKQILKNKKIICITIIIFLGILYIIVNKSINNYNNEIVTEEDNYLVEDTNKEPREQDEELEVVTEEEENIENEEVEELEKIYIYVTGEVNNPGVVMLNKGSRIADAISAAGGTTNNANTTKINLVYILEDGMKVNIPSNNELKKDKEFTYITKKSGDLADDSNISESETIEKKQKENKIDVVNINSATQTELETLPGIGPSIALKIINYRNENGKFSSIEDLKSVNGIGENKFEALKKYITV